MNKRKDGLQPDIPWELYKEIQKQSLFFYLEDKVVLLEGGNVTDLSNPAEPGRSSRPRQETAPDPEGVGLGGGPTESKGEGEGLNRWAPGG